MAFGVIKEQWKKLCNIPTYGKDAVQGFLKEFIEMSDPKFNVRNEVFYLHYEDSDLKKDACLDVFQDYLRFAHNIHVELKKDIRSKIRDNAALAGAGGFTALNNDCEELISLNKTSRFIDFISDMAQGLKDNGHVSHIRIERLRDELADSVYGKDDAIEGKDKNFVLFKQGEKIFSEEESSYIRNCVSGLMNKLSRDKQASLVRG